MTWCISGGFRGGKGVQMHRPLLLVMYFCIHNYTSLSNDYAGVACSNNQAQLNTHVSVPYWSPDVWLGLELIRDIQFGLPAILQDRKWAWLPKIFGCTSRTSGWTPHFKFVNLDCVFHVKVSIWANSDLVFYWTNTNCTFIIYNLFFLFKNVNRHQPTAETPATPAGTPKERAGTARKRRENLWKSPPNSNKG